MNSLTHSTFDEKKTMRDDVYFLSSKKNIKEFRAKYNFFFFFFLEESVNVDKVEKYIQFSYAKIVSIKTISTNAFV